MNTNNENVLLVNSLQDGYYNLWNTNLTKCWNTFNNIRVNLGTVPTACFVCVVGLFFLFFFSILLLKWRYCFFKFFFPKKLYWGTSALTLYIIFEVRQSWAWSYGSCIYNYLCNKCLSPLTLWIKIPLSGGILDTILCDKVCQRLAVGRWFSPDTPVFRHQ
jgi:hypothetical protein